MNIILLDFKSVGFEYFSGTLTFRKQKQKCYFIIHYLQTQIL